MEYDFIIIGTGPSGSVIASNLAKKGYKIAMVDRATDSKNISDKNSFIFAPYINSSPFNYTPLFSNQLGGNSALWNNKIYLLTKDEFNTDNWGFGYKELQQNSKDLSLAYYSRYEKGIIWWQSQIRMILAFRRYGVWFCNL